MQKITCEVLLNKAKELLSNGTVDRVYGWKKGDFSYDVTPAIFRTTEELDKDFIYSDFSGANFSKYLVNETRKSEQKILVFLKPCDTYSFNQLLTEHRFDREKVYVVGIPCEGMLDVNKIKDLCGDFTNVKVNENEAVVSTLFDGDKVVNLTDVQSERCVNCKSKKCVNYDELIGDNGEVTDSNRFDEVEALEKMSADERFEFWRSQLSKCIRCNACRDICPACTCEKCVFDNPESGMENKAAATSFEEQMFHIIRAFHVAGRCTDCGECSRVCPQHIPLHLLNRKFIKDINSFYGDYQAGAEVGSRNPVVNFTQSDLEPYEAFERGEN